MQANMDFWLGNEGPGVYEEFEANMMTKDYALDIRRIRQNAIESCVQIVLEDPSEDLISGWTLSCPRKSNTLRTLPFEECVVLLTNTAFYFCRFEWDSEKVAGYEMVSLYDVTAIWRGAYITSALGGTNLDETKNYGFAIRYNTTKRSIVRRNTRSLQNEGEFIDDIDSTTNEEKQIEPAKGQTQPDTDQTRLMAFKALPPSSSATKDDVQEIEHLSEVDLIKRICDQLQQAVEAAARKGGGSNADDRGSILKVEDHDVISVAEAKRSTGYIESIGYSLKRLVWS
jgi:hypothetical protein